MSSYQLPPYGVQDPYKLYTPNNIASKPASAMDTNSIYPQMTTPTAATPTAKIEKKTGDGKDDGKISFWQKIKSGVSGAVKGLVKGVIGIVTDPKKLLLTAGVIALSIVCPPAGVAIAVVGGAMGAVQVGKGVVKATKATSDAEAKEAFENIGSGTLQVGLSIIGAKAGLKSCGNTTAALATKAEGTGIGAFGSKLGKVAKAFGKDAGESLAKNTKLGGNIASQLDDAAANGGKIKSVGKGIEKTYQESNLGKNITAENSILKGTKNTLKNSVDDLKTTGYNKVADDALTAKTNLETKIDGLSKLDDAAINELKDAPLNSTKDIKSFTEKLNKIDKDNLSAADKATLKDLAKEAQAKNAKINKVDGKYEKLSEKISKQVEEGKLDEIEAQAKLDKLAELEGKGSTLKGATEKVKNWTKETVENNAKRAAEKDLASSADDIKATKTQIEKAENAVKDAKQALKDAADDTGKTTAKSNLSEVEAQLKSLKSKLGIQENLYDTAAFANGTATLNQKVSALNGSVTPAIASNIQHSSGFQTPQQYSEMPQQVMPQQPYVNQQLPELGYNDSTGMWA